MKADPQKAKAPDERVEGTQGAEMAAETIFKHREIKEKEAQDQPQTCPGAIKQAPL